jgi:hypothetical protein
MPPENDRRFGLKRARTAGGRRIFNAYILLHFKYYLKLIKNKIEKYFN